MAMQILYKNFLTLEIGLNVSRIGHLERSELIVLPGLTLLKNQARLI